MSDINPSPVKSAYGRGGSRCGGRGGGRGGRGDRSNRSRSGQIQNQKSRPSAQKFKGDYSDLEGYIFDCSDKIRQTNILLQSQESQSMSVQSLNTAEIYARPLKIPSALRSPCLLHLAIMTQLF